VCSMHDVANRQLWNSERPPLVRVQSALRVRSQLHEDAMIPTARDVALQAGVSVATVSRVLNNTAIVSVLTKEKVMAAISRLDYSPNLAAASLRRGLRPARVMTERTQHWLGMPRTRTSDASDSSKKAKQLQLLKRENGELKRLIRRMSRNLGRWLDPAE
jgi:hypothetical protein